MLEREVVGRWGYVAERGTCVRRDVFHRKLDVEFDPWQRKFKDHDVVQAFIGVGDQRCPAFTKTYGPVGLWIDVHRAVHHSEYAEGERRWYEPDPDGGLPAQLVEDLQRHGEALLNYPATAAEMVDLLAEPDQHPIRHGLSIGQFPGDHEPRLLKALILARWTGDSGLTERALQRVRAATTSPEGLRNVKLWIREYKKITCVDVSGVLD